MIEINLGDMLQAAKERDASCTFRSQFARGDKVICDGAHEIVMTVTAHLFRESYVQIEVSFIANSDLKTQWVEEWRLSNADD